MTEIELSQTAQHWVYVVLIWIGFGTVAGLLARILLPAREPSSAVIIITLGILGSVIGPLVLSLVFHHRVLNPISSPLGMLAAIGGSLILMVLFRLAVSPLLRREEDPETREE